MGRACCSPSSAARAVCNPCSVLPLSDSLKFSGRRDGTVGFMVGSGVTVAQRHFCVNSPDLEWGTAPVSIPGQSVIDHGLTLHSLLSVSGVMKELYKCPQHSHE